MRPSDHEHPSPWYAKGMKLGGLAMKTHSCDDTNDTCMPDALHVQLAAGIPGVATHRINMQTVSDLRQ